MSRLGIAFVLPYQGTNGVKVTNNQIGLDPDANGSIGSLQIGKNYTSKTPDNDTLSIYSKAGTGETIEIYDIDADAVTVELIKTGILIINQIMVVLTIV